MQTALLIRKYLLQFCYGICSSRNNQRRNYERIRFLSVFVA